MTLRTAGPFVDSDNAVKAFKYELKSERLLHTRANAWEVEKCKPWLGAEIETLRPRVLVALGATAGLALASPEPSHPKQALAAFGQDPTRGVRRINDSFGQKA